MPTARSKQYRAKRKKIARKMIVCGAILLGLFLIFDLQIRPVVSSLAAATVKKYAMVQISNAVNQAIAESGKDYDSYVNIQTGPDGSVLSIQTRAQEITLIHTAIIEKVNQAITQFETANLSIPLGSFSGITFLSGLGPNVNIKILPAGSAESKVISSLSEAGVNQTLHTISIEISAPLMAIVPGCSERTQAEGSFLLAESVIVGKVPNYYTKVVSDHQEDPMTNIDRYGNPRFSSETAGES